MGRLERQASLPKLFRNKFLKGYMSKQRYRFSELKRTTYLSCDGSIRDNFESWISGMVQDIDGKCGQDRLVDGTTIPGFLCEMEREFERRERARSFGPKRDYDLRWEAALARSAERLTKKWLETQKTRRNGL